jgi:hypothetical protein
MYRSQSKPRFFLTIARVDEFAARLLRLDRGVETILDARAIARRLPPSVDHRVPPVAG